LLLGPKLEQSFFGWRLVAERKLSPTSGEKLMTTDAKVRLGMTAWFEAVGRLMREAALRSGLSPELNASLVELCTDKGELSEAVSRGSASTPSAAGHRSGRGAAGRADGRDGRGNGRGCAEVEFVG
jgi:hypothetical protein